MSGDWIKMRSNLDTDPRVVRMADNLNVSELFLVGCLWKVWSWADQHSVTGKSIPITCKFIDRLVGVVGFADELRLVGWLLGDDGNISFPNFEEHNGATAKKRASGAARVAKHREKKVTPERYKSNKETISKTLRAMIYGRDGEQCVYCKRGKNEVKPTESKSDGYLTLDHVIPESQGGDSTEENLVSCCNSCNRKKSDRTPEEAQMTWPVNGVTGERYGSVTKALPEKRREENKKSKPKKVEKPLPPDWQPSETLAAWFKNQDFSFTLDDMAEEFRNGCKAKGYTYVDFDAAFRTWCKKRQERLPAQPRDRYRPA